MSLIIVDQRSSGVIILASAPGLQAVEERIAGSIPSFPQTRKIARLLEADEESYDLKFRGVPLLVMNAFQNSQTERAVLNVSRFHPFAMHQLAAGEHFLQEFMLLLKSVFLFRLQISHEIVG